MPASIHQVRSSQVGFTLVELVIGIIVFSVVLTIVTSVVAPQARRSVDPMLQVRATEIAQSMFNEILGKSFDENSDRVGGRVRCNEDLDGNGNLNGSGESACTFDFSAANFGLGADNGEPSRQDFDDVDDYNNQGLSNSLAENLDSAGRYSGFQATIVVGYDGNMNGTLNEVDGANNLLQAERTAKRVNIRITTPNNEQLDFSAYRFNF